MGQRQKMKQPQRAVELASSNRVSESSKPRTASSSTVFTVCGLLLLAVVVVFGPTVAFDFADSRKNLALVLDLQGKAH
jgi:hypothetical protein